MTINEIASNLLAGDRLYASGRSEMFAEEIESSEDDGQYEYQISFHYGAMPAHHAENYKSAYECAVAMMGYDDNWCILEYDEAGNVLESGKRSDAPKASAIIPNPVSDEPGEIVNASLSYDTSGRVRWHVSSREQDYILLVPEPRIPASIIAWFVMATVGYDISDLSDDDAWHYSVV